MTPQEEAAAPAAAEQGRTLRVGPPMYGGTFHARDEPLRDGTDNLDLPFVLKGELIRISGDAAKDRSPYAPAEVIEPSAYRVLPQCRHFGVCGGCHYQHMAQAEQVRTKAELLQAMLVERRIALPSPGIRAHAGEPWQYRNRMRLRLHAGEVGYSRRRSNEFLPIAECPIVSPLLWRASELMQDLHRLWPARASEVEFFANGSDDALQMSLHLDSPMTAIDRSAPAQFRGLCTALHTALPELQGAGLLAQSEADVQASRRVQERRRVEVARWGSSGLDYRVGRHTYGVSRNAFFQVNRFLTEKMIDLVVGGRSGALAVDLFAGAGLFSVALTQGFARVVSVEIGQPAADDLAAVLRACGAQHRAEHKTTLAFLREWNRRSPGVPDLVVVDPPRAGLGREVVSELLKLGATELAYVSCDPATFVRDCAALVESRYTLDEVHLLDLFPQTFHMETIATFRRR